MTVANETSDALASVVGENEMSAGDLRKFLAKISEDYGSLKRQFLENEKILKKKT